MRGVLFSALGVALEDVFQQTPACRLRQVQHLFKAPGSVVIGVRDFPQAQSRGVFEE